MFYLLNFVCLIQNVATHLCRDNNIIFFYDSIFITSKPLTFRKKVLLIFDFMFLFVTVVRSLHLCPLPLDLPGAWLQRVDQVA